MFTAKICQTSLILASFFSIGLCIKCFQCNSAEHKDCRDLTVNDTKSAFFKECPVKDVNHKPFCRKLATEVQDTENSKRILRTCGWINTDKKEDYCRKSDSDFMKKMSCQCFSDACNSSDWRAPSRKLTIILSSVVFILLHFMYRN